jgi:hypothetical protein
MIDNVWVKASGSNELRSSPIVLIGAHSNLWTTKLMTELRFSFGERIPSLIVWEENH